MTAPTFGPGKHLRAGSQVHRTLYLGDADDEKGVLIGVVDTPELAAHVVAAVNAWDWESGTSDRRKARGVPAIRRFTATDGTTTFEGVMFSMGICVIAHPDEGLSRAYSSPEVAFEDLTITWIDTAEES